MSTAGMKSLTAEEVRSFRRRFLWMRLAIGAYGVVAVACLLTLGHWGPVFWMAPVVPAVILSFVLYARATRCPRCRQSVWSNPPPGEDGNPGFNLFGQFHPDHCRACGVLLISSSSG